MARPASVNHTTVLATAATNALVDGDGCYIDATFGGGGHSRQLLRRLSPAARLIALDCDEYAAACAADIDDARFCFVRQNFAELSDVARQNAAVNVRGVLFDLGISSLQLDSAERGLSFRRRGPLDMRMDRRQEQTARTFLSSCSERTLIRILKEYGEEPEARRVGQAIYARRRQIADTAELATIVTDAKRAHPPGKHPATLTFQALRIAVNREWDSLWRGLKAASTILARGGRLAVIAFHSLEERMIKRALSSPAFPGIGQIEPSLLQPLGQVIIPSAAEIADNPRARSARMRVFVKGATP